MPDTKQSPQFKNLVQVLASSVERFGERPLFGALVGEDIQWTSYRDFGALVDKFRAGLAELGIKSGDAVGIISNNRMEWAVAAHAALGLGAHYVPMYEQQSIEDWQYILSDAEVSVCFVANGGVAERLKPLHATLPKLREVVNFEGAADQPKTYAALLAAGEGKRVPAQQPAADETAVLIYTSGTTGKPKGVVLSHKNIASNVNALLQVVAVNEGDRGLAFLPWAHIFGGSIELNLTIVTGSSTVVCADAFQLQHYLPRVKPTVLFAVPRVWNKIYDGVQKLMVGQQVFTDALNARAKQRRNEEPSATELEALANAQANIFPLIRGAFGGQLRYACSGAAALSREVGEFMDTLGIEVIEGYGMTETGGVMTTQPEGGIRLGSVGKALPGVRLELDKSVAGAGPDEGEIIVYGDAVMSGYYKQSDATRATMTDDGGLRTGDIGRIDADGYLFLTGRAKELYKLENGKYVAPVPLEETLSLSPYILQSVVYGSGRQFNTALIIPDLPALTTWAKQNAITLEGEALLSEPKALALLEAEVAKANQTFKGYERIQSFVVDGEEMTTGNGMLTQTMKLKRKAFNDKYAEALDSLYPRATEPDAPRVSYIRELQPVKTGTSS